MIASTEIAIEVGATVALVFALQGRTAPELSDEAIRMLADRLEAGEEITVEDIDQVIGK